MKMADAAFISLVSLCSSLSNGAQHHLLQSVATLRTAGNLFAEKTPIILMGVFDWLALRLVMSYGDFSYPQGTVALFDKGYIL